MPDDARALAPRDPAFEARVRASFGRQSMMATLGARLVRVEPGACEIELPVSDGILQQHGFVHAAAVAAIADSAAGYSALSLMAPGRGVLSVEYKINLLAPAAGDRLVARGRVVRAGRSLTVATAEVEAIDGDEAKAVAILTATLVSVEGSGGIVD